MPANASLADELKFILGNHDGNTMNSRDFNLTTVSVALSKDNGKRYTTQQNLNPRHSMNNIDRGNQVTEPDKRNSVAVMRGKNLLTPTASSQINPIKSSRP